MANAVQVRTMWKKRQSARERKKRLEEAKHRIVYTQRTYATNTPIRYITPVRYMHAYK